MAVAEPLNTTPSRAPVVYDALISYSHAKDKPIATALQSVVQKIAKAWYRRRALRVFRDDTSLSATPHLWPSIEQALGQSRFLILLASPEAAASRWVGQEIAYWLDHKSADTVLIALTEGELDWDQATSDFRWSLTPPLPAALKNRFASEPRWIDLRPYRGGSISMGTEFMGLGADFAAAIHGIPKEDLLSEEVRQQRRARTLAGTAATLLVALLVAAGWQWRVAETQRGIAEAQTKVAEAQTKEAQTQRNEAQLNFREVQKTESNFRSEQAKQTGADAVTAALLALEGLPDATASDDAQRTRPFVNEAWYVLYRARLKQLERAVLSGHTDAVASAVFAPDGGRILTASFDRTARLWDRDGKPLAVLQGHTAPVYRAVFAPDGGRILTASDDQTARLWDRDGKPLAILEGHTAPVYRAVFAPDGGRILTASGDNTARLWDRDGKPLAILEGHTAPIHSAVFSADGGRILTASNDRTARLWEAFPDPQTLVDRVKVEVPRCLSPEQRKRFFLAPTPPRWCAVMHKWPYDGTTTVR
jgi:MTH538 TIR-like domain (DUF1863)/WD domain, G-beta repeat